MHTHKHVDQDVESLERFWLDSNPYSPAARKKAGTFMLCIYNAAVAVAVAAAAAAGWGKNATHFCIFDVNFSQQW